MRLEYYSEEKLKKELLEIIGKHVDLSAYKVFVFGSRVSGGGDDRSDIDIGIEGMEAVPDGAMANIKEAIEDLPTLYKIDVIDFAQTDKKFKSVAKQHVEMLH
jgi:uncharacterized protein